MPVHLHPFPTPDVTQADIDRWRKVPVAVAVDVGVCPGQIDPAIRPLRAPGQQPLLFGQAVTVQCTPPDFGAVLGALDQINAGQVLVIAAGGDRRTAMIGGILSGHLRRKGVVGVVVDGAVRDVATLASWPDFAVFSRSVTPRGPIGADQGAINLTVDIGGCKIAPGDLILGDDDGLVALNPASIRDKIGAAEAKLDREDQWIKGLESGRAAAEVFGLALPKTL